MSNTVDHLREALRGRYEIEGELGQGGMAIVYLARDLKHNRDVAGSRLGFRPGWQELRVDALARRHSDRIAPAEEREHHIWIKELPDGAERRLTFHEADQRTPFWTPDGQTVTYMSGVVGTCGSERRTEPVRPSSCWTTT